MGCGQIKVPGSEATFALRGEEDCDTSDQKGLRKTLHDGVEQSAKIGLGVDAAAKLDESFAVVKTLLIEDTVHAGLNGAFEWIEGDSSDDDGGE